MENLGLLPLHCVIREIGIGQKFSRMSYDLPGRGWARQNFYVVPFFLYVSTVILSGKQYSWVFEVVDHEFDISFPPRTSMTKSEVSKT